LTDAFTGNGGRESASFIFDNGTWVQNRFSSLASLISLLVSGPINFGLAAYFLGLSRNDEGSLDDLFSGFPLFGKTFLLHVLMMVFTFLWALLLIIPGIIAALRYSMSYYIMNDHPEIGPMEAIEMSKELMDGQKMRLFTLTLSFIGWFLLGIITFGLGFLYLMPYYNATIANFYEDLKAPKLGYSY
jgi:uncharacterized membrane protein